MDWNGMNPRDLRTFLQEIIFQQGVESVTPVERDFAGGTIFFEEYQSICNAQYLRGLKDGSLRPRLGGGD